MQNTGNMNIKKIIITGIVLLSIILISFIKPNTNNLNPKNRDIFATDIDENIIYSNIQKEFGITLDSFYVVQNRIKRNQNLAFILSETGLNDSIVNIATLNSASVFNIRNIQLGNQYNLYFTRDKDSTLKYFVYKHSPTEYLKIDLNKKPQACKGEKQIITNVKTSTGTISTSLWNTMIENNIDPVMAIRLSEIYAWTVDFFGLDRGDHFKVIYEEQFVDSIPIGIGRIFAANFTHKGEELFAFEYEQNGVLSYYDENGKSLRRQFLKAPLRFSHISSKFSKSRMHPILKIRRPHSGVDYSAPTGTPVYTIGDGTVIDKGYTKSAGNYIKIRHNSVYTSGYNHLSRYSNGIKIGQRVNQGQIIGYVGSTGYATGPHLDFRVWMNGQAIDPLKIKAPPIEPIKEENLPTYQASINQVKQELRALN